MRWGIVGVGKIVLDRFLPDIEKVEGAELKFFVTNHPDKVKDLAEKYKELLEKNIVGKVGIIKASFSFVNLNREAWRYNMDLAGGGAIMDIGVHVINTLHFFRPNNRIIEVVSINEFYDYEVEQNAGAVAKFDDGVIVLMDASYDTSLISGV